MANLQSITKRSDVGTIKPWGKATAPVGYLLCDGTAVSRTDYADLFGIISTTYGSGNGSTTFNVPNLQGKMVQGYDGSTYNLGATSGANTVTVAVTNNQAGSSTVTNNQSVTVTGSIDNTSLTTAQLAAHTHSINQNNGPITSRSPKYSKMLGQQVNDGGPVWSPSPANNTGSGTGHTHSHNLSGTLTGTVAVSTNLTGTVTVAGTNSFSPYVVTNYIIRH